MPRNQGKNQAENPGATTVTGRHPLCEPAIQRLPPATEAARALQAADRVNRQRELLAMSPDYGVLEARLLAHYTGNTPHIDQIAERVAAGMVEVGPLPVEFEASTTWPDTCPERHDGGPHVYSRKPKFGNLVTCDECGDIADEDDNKERED